MPASSARALRRRRDCARRGTGRRRDARLERVAHAEGAFHHVARGLVADERGRNGCHDGARVGGRLVHGGRMAATLSDRRDHLLRRRRIFRLAFADLDDDGAAPGVVGVQRGGRIAQLNQRLLRQLQIAVHLRQGVLHHAPPRIVDLTGEIADDRRQAPARVDLRRLRLDGCRAAHGDGGEHAKQRQNDRKPAEDSRADRKTVETKIEAETKHGHYPLRAPPLLGRGASVLVTSSHAAG